MTRPDLTLEDLLTPDEREMTRLDLTLEDLLNTRWIHPEDLMDGVVPAVNHCTSSTWNVLRSWTYVFLPHPHKTMTGWGNEYAYQLSSGSHCTVNLFSKTSHCTPWICTVFICQVNLKNLGENTFTLCVVICVNIQHRLRTQWMVSPIILAEFADNELNILSSWSSMLLLQINKLEFGPLHKGLYREHS